MEDLRNLVTANESKIESLARKIPGFSGYLNRENRRDSDALQREFLARRLGQLKSNMQTAQEELLSAGNLAIMEPFDRVGNKLDRVVERVRHASRGYAGFFDAVKVNEAELDRVYEYDAALVGTVSSAEEAMMAISAQASEGGDVKSLVRALGSAIDELDRSLDGREQILRGVG